MSLVAFTCRSIRGPVGGGAGDGCKLDMSRVNVPWPSRQTSAKDKLLVHPDPTWTEGPSYAMVVASVSEACQLTPGGQRRLEPCLDLASTTAPSHALAAAALAWAWCWPC